MDYIVVMEMLNKFRWFLGGKVENVSSLFEYTNIVGVQDDHS